MSESEKITVRLPTNALLQLKELMGVYKDSNQSTLIRMAISHLHEKTFSPKKREGGL